VARFFVRPFVAATDLDFFGTFDATAWSFAFALLVRFDCLASSTISPSLHSVVSEVVSLVARFLVRPFVSATDLDFLGTFKATAWSFAFALLVRSDCLRDCFMPSFGNDSICYTWDQDALRLIVNMLTRGSIKSSPIIAWSREACFLPQDLERSFLIAYMGVRYSPSLLFTLATTATATATATTTAVGTKQVLAWPTAEYPPKNQPQFSHLMIW